MTFLSIGFKNSRMTELQTTIFICTSLLFSSVTSSFMPHDEVNCAGHDDDHCRPSLIASSIDLALKSGFKNRSYKRPHDYKNKYLSYLKQVRAFPSRYGSRYQSGILYNTQQHTTFNMCVTCVLYLKPEV